MELQIPPSAKLNFKVDDEKLRREGVTRTSHSGEQVVTRGPTSNKIDRAATYNYYQGLKQKGYNVDKQLKKYGPNK